MPETITREVVLLGEDVEYEVRQSNDATEPRIDVDIWGVTVVLPEGSDEKPETLLKENAAWVIEKQRNYQSYREQVPDRQFEPGEQFPYLGEPHEIVIEKRSASGVEDSTLKLAKHHVEQTSVERALEALYRREARETLTSRADHYAAEMEVGYSEIELRNQRTRWGSCSTSGTLSLNWRLIMAPIDIMDYIVVHELAHLKEQNHTSRFWQLVGEYIPDYKQRATWLDENSPKLIFSEDDL